jgi:hypothetical protein
MGYFYLNNIKEDRLYEILYNNVKCFFIKYKDIFYDIDGYDIKVGDLYKINLREKIDFEIDKIKYIKYYQIINFEIIKNKIKILKLDNSQKVLY